jgi:cytochrome c oxidase cbb3-type subunit III
MADFVSEFWNLYVIVLSALSIAACAVLLYALSRQKVAPGQDPGTTGHVWDENLQEYNNPLPRWWMMLFYITIVFSVVYLVLYPGLGNTKGVLGWSSTGQHAKEIEKADKEFGPLYAKFAAMDIETLAKDPAGMAIGQRLFLNNCAQCHGSDGRGAKGFPNLADADWLWGGTPQAIKISVLEGRQGVMPPMAAALGSPEMVENVANYVLSLSGTPHDTAKAAAGKPMFAACAACHGANGEGNISMGAPRLSDKTWLVSGTVAGITNTINNGRHGVMPAWKDFLGEQKSHIVSAYVYSLSQQK